MNVLNPNNKELDNLIVSLEKVSKIIKFNIVNGDKTTPLQDLDWLEENFYLLFNLQNFNAEKFYSIIDPNANLYQQPTSINPTLSSC
jgi:hypothetical protein